MDVIELARQLGHELQNDARFAEANAAAAAANADEALGKMVADFETMRRELEALAADRENDNAARAGELDKQMHAAYESINSHPAMVRYAQSGAELEELVNYIVKIITAAANGENPDTVEKESACTGSCETCGGCH